MPSAGEIVVESLVGWGIDRLFCVPGESYLGLLDALHGRADIDTVVCRHESGAGFMALADARLTGRPGVACVSRGPGASNAAIAVHTAQQDAVPFLLLVGQVGRADLRRDAFQEVDYTRMFGGMAKWVGEVTDPDQVGEAMLRALRTATTGTPGPVVLALPEDVLTAASTGNPAPARPPVVAGPPAQAVARLRDLLAAAARPLLLAGSAFERAEARPALQRCAEDWSLPVLVSFRRQDLFPNNHPLYAGDMGLANPPAQVAALRDADLLVVLGARLGDINTQGYSFPGLGGAPMTLVHVHADPAMLGTQMAADLAVACDPLELIAALGAAPALPDRSAWVARLAACRRAIATPRLPEVDDGIAFERVVDLLGRHLAPDAVVTVDAGTFGAPAYRLIPFTPPQRLLAPIAGAMGYGVPAAVAAGLRAAGRQVVCLVGDGGFLMTGSELAVALERGLALKVILSENGIYASIRVQQERSYPGRVSGTGFVNPDLALIGQAYGMRATRLDTVEELGRLPELLARPGGDFIVVRTSVQAILPH